jgi:hypothetical protein
MLSFSTWPDMNVEESLRKNYMCHLKTKLIRGKDPPRYGEAI